MGPESGAGMRLRPRLKGHCHPGKRGTIVRDLGKLGPGHFAGAKFRDDSSERQRLFLFFDRHPVLFSLFELRAGGFEARIDLMEFIGIATK